MIKTKFLSAVLCVCMILSVCTISSFAEPTLKIGDFNYYTTKISVSADTSDANAVDAMLYVYRNDGNPMSDENPPLFVDFIALSNGAFSEMDIPLPLDLAYGDYKVELYYDNAKPHLEGEFSYYNPTDLIEVRKAQILEEAKSATSAGSVKKVLFDVNSAGGTKIPTNASLFKSDADFTDYNSVTDKDEVFNHMISEGHANLTSYNKLVELFEKCAKKQNDAENRPVTPGVSQTPSNDNTVSGGVSGGISIAPSGSSVGGGSSVSAPSGSTPSVAPVFTDMKDHWALEYANVLSSKNIINGYADGSFKAENNITRAELTKILVTGFNIGGDLPAVFTDVSEDSWYYEYVRRASAAGVVNGYNGMFTPDGNITRQDAALMVFRVIDGIIKLPKGSSAFKDDAKIASYASDAIKSLAAVKILTGDTNGNFNPNAPITRAEIAACVCRALEYAQLN